MMVKICGITTEDDALQAAEAGASAIGFNFYRKSPRYVTPEAARRMGERLPAEVLRVGIFVDATTAEIEVGAKEAALDIVQLYGDCRAVGLRVWRACAAGSALDDATAEAFLLDTPSRTLHGGTGRTFDWALARHAGKRIVLAGGLDASNVRAAIEAADPWGVDACSRLETSAGRKDPRRVKDFIQAALNL